MRIIVDAMGGDNAPEEIIKGVLCVASKIDDSFILVAIKVKFCAVLRMILQPAIKLR